MENFSKGEKIALILCLCGSAFMNLLDTTIVNVSIPHIAGSFGVSATDGTWVITSYAVSEAIMLPLIGWLSKRVGITKLFISGTLIFAFFSACCGLSPTFNTVLFFRVMQGVVGASMIPLSQTLMTSLYPPEKRSFPLGLWSMTVVFAPIVGPILGGWITDNLNWRWCFYVNVPISIITMGTAYMIYKKNGVKDSTLKLPVDVWGIVFLALGVGSLQVMLDKGNQYNWFENSTIVALAISAFIFMGITIIWELGKKDAIINIRLFRHKNFCVGAIGLFTAIAVINAMVVVVPLWLQDYMGYTSFKSGTTLFYQSIPVLIFAPLLGRYGGRIDARKMMALGFFIMAIISIFVSPFPSDPSQFYISYTRFLLGIGTGLFFVPANILALSNLPQEEMASASGLFNFMRDLGITFGTAMSTNYWKHQITFFHATLGEAITPGNPNLAGYLAKLPGNELTKLAIVNEEITKQAVTMAVNQIFYVAGVLMIVLIPFLFVANNTVQSKKGE
jgi:DHA2 family multidrug resistance protein